MHNPYCFSITKFFVKTECIMSKEELHVSKFVKLDYSDDFFRQYAVT